MSSSPNRGCSRPGVTAACGDSHTLTHGVFGSPAFGICASEVGHVLATQTIRQRHSLNIRITVDGRLASLVYAKDLALWLLVKVGVDGAVGHVIEYGAGTGALSMKALVTLCNLRI